MMRQCELAKAARTLAMHTAARAAPALAPWPTSMLAPLSSLIWMERLSVSVPSRRVMRLGALIYALGPLVTGRRPRAGARAAFGLAERLRPWSMAEIFIVGVTVALIKVAGMAAVTIGPAFWAFAGVVIITILKDQLICRYSIWEALDKARG